MSPFFIKVPMRYVSKDHHQSPSKEKPYNDISRIMDTSYDTCYDGECSDDEKNPGNFFISPECMECPP